MFSNIGATTPAEAESESVEIVALENDTIDFIVGFERVPKISLSSEEELPSFDALLISQTALDSSENDELVENIVEFATKNKLLLIANELETIPLDVSNDRYSTQISFSSPVIATTVISVDGQEINGAILDATSTTDALLDIERIEPALQNLMKIKDESFFEPLSSDSSKVSIANISCPYRNYLEIVEVVDINDSASLPLENGWLIRLSQALSEEYSGCSEMNRIRSIADLISDNGGIANYVPTTSPGSQISNLSDEYSWTVGQADVDVIDIGNTPSAAGWLFDFQKATTATGYHLTQPGLLAYLPTNQPFDIRRTVGFTDAEVEDVMLQQEHPSMLSWSISVHMLEE